MAGTQPYTSDIWGILRGVHCWELVLVTVNGGNCSFRLTLQGL